jgi:hypothetical protein
VQKDEPRPLDADIQNVHAQRFARQGTFDGERAGHLIELLERERR